MSEDDDLPDDALPAFLFRSVGDPELVAVSPDSTGAMLPSDSGGWQLERAFALGVHEAVPVAMNPEPIMRGINANGYYMWHDRHLPIARGDASRNVAKPSRRSPRKRHATVQLPTQLAGLLDAAFFPASKII